MSSVDFVKPSKQSGSGFLQLWYWSLQWAPNQHVILFAVTSDKENFRSYLADGYVIGPVVKQNFTVLNKGSYMSGYFIYKLF